MILLVLLLYIKNKGWWWGTVGGVTLTCCDDACPPIATRAVPNPLVAHEAREANHSSRNKLVKTFSFDGGESSSESEMGCSRSRHNSDVPSLGPPSQFLPQRHDLISLVEKGRMGMSSNSSCCSSTTSSLGEKHGLAPTKVTAEVNEALRRCALAAALCFSQTTIAFQNTRSEGDSNRQSALLQGGERQPARAGRHQPQPGLQSNQVFQCIVVMHPECEERAEDVDVDDTITIACEMEAKETADQGGRLNRCGHLEVALLYDAPMRKMTVHVLQARDIPSRDRGQPTNTQVRLILLPSKKQKHKTKIRSGENPQYMESFLLHRVNPEDVNSMGIRLRLYGCERMRRERLIGEAVVSFANINLELENNFWLTMESRSNT
ncbi:hypothetical protein D910_01251, partial [Dendroctonus ponderosae]